MKWLLVLSLIYLLPWSAQASKILFVVPMPAHSHFTLVFRLAKELADRGHEVTVINPYPQKTPIKNYRDVPVTEVIDYVEDVKKSLFKWFKYGTLGSMKLIFEMGVAIADLTYSCESVQKLLHSDEKFDVVIMEYFWTDALLGIAHHFGAPSIIISPLGVNDATNHFFDNPAPSSYVPNVSGSFTKTMTFWERLQNYLTNLVMITLREVSFAPQQRTIFKKYIKTDVDINDVIYNISLELANAHYSIHDAVPHVPNIIDIGGYHVSPPKKLSDDLLRFLDQSRDGAILFSMGSNLKSKDLKPEIRKALLQAFAKIKQNVLWKFETDLPEAPKNVKIMSWVPQTDILAHPNIKAFITHGGLLSTIETVYHGVPIIGIPVFGDQKTNIGRVVNDGYGVNVPLDELTEEKISKALDEVLNHPKYATNVKKRSSLMHDRPLSPIDTAVYWVEHVIRHGGAPHLRTAALNLKWYQREMLDVIGFLVVVTVLILATLYLTLKKVASFLCPQKKITKISKTKKKQ